VASNIYRQGGPNYNRERDIRASVFTAGNAPDDGARYASQVAFTPITTATAVEISFNATTKTLTGGYDADGAANNYLFLPITDLTGNASGWGMNAASTFTIYLQGVSGNDAGGTVGVTIGTAGLATLDNLSGTGLTAIPEPSSYAAMAGVVALGLVVWRRRQTARTA
jgi:hypothetical protein